MKKIFLVTIIFIFILSACTAINSEEKITVSVTEGDNTRSVQTLRGVTVDQVLKEQQVNLNPLDKVSPPLTTFLNGGEFIVITRVTEEFSVVETVLPFEQQTIKNESLAEGQTVLIQSGVNGRKQSTYRIVFENGIEAVKTIVKEEIIQASKPEILMIGVQSPFSAVNIAGIIAYISTGNAWVMEVNTGNRKVVVSTGDLDGRIFSLSYDRKWLLFSRSANDPTGEKINSLWLVDITKEDSQLIDTGIHDVVHYADWIPGKIRTFSYSTVEPRTTAPGWQANNDLHVYRFDVDGEKADNTLLVESNSGGIYGWWGTSFQWSPDGSALAYSRPDSVGLVDIKNGELNSLLDFTPYQAKTDWAWVPSLNWSPDGSILFTIQLSSSNDNRLASTFDLTAINITSKKVMPLVSKCGLFCYPVSGSSIDGGKYRLAYLSAILVEQSESSSYNLYVMDRDGSNRFKLYPGEGQQGLDPQFISWSPGADEAGTTRLAFLAQGNIMLAELPSGSIKQVTGDGSVIRIIWR